MRLFHPSLEDRQVYPGLVAGQTTQSTPGTGAFQGSLHPPEGPSQEVQTGDFHIVIQQSFYSHGQKFR